MLGPVCRCVIGVMTALVAIFITYFSRTLTKIKFDAMNKFVGEDGSSHRTDPRA